MNLSLIIPVRNDQVGVTKLIEQVLGFNLFEQIIVVDDGSDVPVVVPKGIELIRSDTSRGAGAARNQGLDLVRCDHTLFFDSDDLFTHELPELWADLQSKPAFDFCLFRHNDNRVFLRQSWGQMPLDNALWRRSGGHGALWRVSQNARAALVQTANYPWNKIYRTDFLKDHKLQFSKHVVHNDITMHWQSFALAKIIFASNRVAAHHIVTPHADRLTNEAGRVRLGVFEPLSIAAKVVAHDKFLQSAFFQFSAGLLDWVRDILDPDLYEELDANTASFWQKHLDSDSFERVSQHDPILALRLALQMAGGQSPC